MHPADGITPFPSRQRRRVAVVGSGISGLSAAWLLAKTHDVTLFEKEQWIGGHSNTVDVDTPGGPIAVDTGFIVYNEKNYPNLTALLEHLGVGSKPSNMSFAASLRGGTCEYASSDLNGILGQRTNMLKPRFWRMLRDILKFYGECRVMAAADLPPEGETLGSYLELRGYSDALVDDHVLPMCAAIWSTSAAEIKDFPLRSFVRFYFNHGLLDIGNPPTWRTVTGGSRTYVDRLLQDIGPRVRRGIAARRVHRLANSVVIEDERGRQEQFDDVVLAAHADDALRLLDDPAPDESRLLGAFRYTPNTAVLHQDASLMPRRRRVWSSWNFIAGDQPDTDASLCVTYWMNRLQSLEPGSQLFVTLNPCREPRPETVKATFEYSHPLLNGKALRAQEQLWTLQGRRNTWFCGAYFGYGFHEDGLQSGLAVAEALSGARRPWTVDNESGRITLAPRYLEAAE